MPNFSAQSVENLTATSSEATLSGHSIYVPRLSPACLVFLIIIIVVVVIIIASMSAKCRQNTTGLMRLSIP